MRCPIILASDEAYGMPLATTLRSITDANRRWWPLDIHILASSVSAETRRKIGASLPKGAAQIDWVPIEADRFDGLWTQHHISKATYARLLIPALFPEISTKVLYLDSDLLVLNDLYHLWATDLDGAVLGAVRDGLDAQIKSGKLASNVIPRVKDYFNAGVLLIDLSRWREELISEKAMHYLKENPTSLFSDQDALNVACDGLWKQLDPRWNFVDHHEQADIGRLVPEQRPWILHFATSRKPWNANVATVNSGFYESFRDRTQFARNRVEIFRDTLRRHWSQLKQIMKTIPVVSAIWNHLRRW